MVDKYDPKQIEPKWQARWEADGLYRSVVDWDRPKYYALTMLPYPSGDLHMGHWYAMSPSDARARWMRMRGFNVLFPMGFDAFGLPAENAAIKRGIHPKQWTYQNIETMRRQLRSMGAMFDWEREAISSDPAYYRWTQWFFLKLYQRGLAYRQEAAVDFCPHCNTTLAREQVWGEDRHCERCGTPVIKKNLEQWFFRITRYADELLADLERIDWPERVKAMQTNWIGRSEGAEVVFRTEDGDPMPVFTTRPDTLWGATFMVLAPEHPLVAKVTTAAQQEAVEGYVAAAQRTSDIEREAADREKTGVFTGGYAVNPVNGERIPIWIADYVLMSYGSGAIMAVPAHDERDFAFALKFGLPIIPVIARPDGAARSFALAGKWMKEGFTAALEAAGIGYRAEGDQLFISLHVDQVETYIPIAQAHLQPGCWNDVVGSGWVFIFEDEVIAFDSVEADRRILARCKALEPSAAGARTVMEMLYTQPWYREILYHDSYGDMIHSGAFTGTPGRLEQPDGVVDERYAKAKVTAWLEEKGIGKKAVNYRLRDWLISRQRYWGAPIPIVYCATCGTVPVPEKDLPVLLPDDVAFMPTGESPLKFHEGFRETTCPRCGEPGQRETDTMDTFMCSSWYQYRYLSPRYDKGPWDPEEGAYWLPVDQYTGGIEHATMHLIYTRFFTKAIRDCGVFDETDRIRRARGLPAVPDGGFAPYTDEPMTRLFNQGMILGEAQEGHVIIAEGERHREAHLTARSIRVVSEAEAHAAQRDDVVVGEVWERKETDLDVRTFGKGHVTVSVTPETVIEIPGIGPRAQVEDLRVHLEAEKMSKSRGNVIAPDELVNQYGADTVRAYLMFAFRWEQGGPWDSKGIQGVVRWLNDVWELVVGAKSASVGGANEDESSRRKAEAALRRRVHQTIRRVTEGFESFGFNTAVAALMELKNTMQAAKRTPVAHSAAWDEAVGALLLMMAPFVPHIAEELWARAGRPYSIHQQGWPVYDPAIAAEETITLVVQVNGKVRDRIDVPADISEDEAKARALASENARKFMDGKPPRQVIYVAKRGIVNIVV